MNDSESSPLLSPPRFSEYVKVSSIEEDRSTRTQSVPARKNVSSHWSNLSFRPIQFIFLVAILVGVFIFALLRYKDYQRSIDPLRIIAFNTYFDTSKLTWSEEWITQRVDHFSWPSTYTSSQPPLFYKQRYLINNQTWDPNDPKAPIFFYTGNEASDVTLYANHTGLMWEYASHFKALIVFAEHRFYGLSQPFNSSQLIPSQLRYLSHEQAVADYAVLLKHIQDRFHGERHPVIAFGGSYGGMLAAWFRIKYPGIVHGAIASSAPIFGFPEGYPTINVSDYWKIVTQNAQITAGSAANCVENVREAWNVLFSLAETLSGRSQLAKIFHTCGPLEHISDVHHLALWSLNAFSVLSMGNYPYPSAYLSNGKAELPAWPMHSACSFLADQHPDPITLVSSLFRAVSVLYNATKQMECVNVPRNMQSIDGIWDFHYCTEMLPQETYFSSNGITDMFWNRTVTMTFVRQHCERVWGTVPDPEFIRILYGDASSLLSAASNIVFTNGMLDPWRCCGVKKSPARNKRIKVLNIEKAAHHLDLFFHHSDDPKAVIDARYVQVSNIRSWIEEFYYITTK
ncbi:unnamed protein product [Albugo candida]|uniref:Lysosomal Pro-X carboxypeptidase n=1 Tax=Albugo candida TaxID=65357 RepID=A0A024GF82_9STRA|nr:unnamed protein product [Albugo candida]|eukprot:CCI45534.1 unnamed protein product [Albugo candida]